MTTKEHIAFIDRRYLYTEDDVHHYTDPRPINCGTWHNGSQVFCDECSAELEKQYPQGWKHYPGDVCVHRMYVGGCGIDWMCPLCENGLDTWVEDPQFMLQVKMEWDDLDAEGQWWPTEQYASRDNTAYWRTKEVQDTHMPQQLIYRISELLKMEKDIHENEGILRLTYQAIQIDSGYWA